MCEVDMAGDDVIGYDVPFFIGNRKLSDVTPGTIKALRGY